MTHLDRLYLKEVALERTLTSLLMKKKYLTMNKMKKRAKKHLSLPQKLKLKLKVSPILWKRIIKIPMMALKMKTLMKKILILSSHFTVTESNFLFDLCTCLNMITGYVKNSFGLSCIPTSITRLSVWSSWTLYFWDASIMNKLTWTSHWKNKTKWTSLLINLRFTSWQHSELNVYQKSLEWASLLTKEATLEIHGIGLISWLLSVHS